MARIFSPITNETIPACPGDIVRETFELVDDHLVKTGEINIDDYINSFRDECLIENIVRRVQGGDIRALNAVQGVYIDSTAIPNNLHDAHRSVINAKTFYHNLSEDLRKDYPDFNSFIDEIGTADGLGRFVSRLSKPDKAAAESVSGGVTNE